MGELGISKFFGHRLQISMTRATAEDSTAGLGQTLRTGRPLVGGSCFHGVSGMCANPLAHRPRGTQAQTVREGGPALGVGLAVIRTPWALSVVSGVDPT